MLPPTIPARPSKPRKKGPPLGLHVDTPAHNPSLVLALQDDSASTSAIISATSDSDSFQFPPPPKSRSSRNMKKLSLSLSSAQSSTTSLVIPQQGLSPDVPSPERPRRASIVSLPAPSTTALFRKEEDGNSPSAPYVDGPVEILPNIWLGSEDNVHDWQGLVQRRIGSVLNVAKEVVSPFDSVTSRPLRPVSSTPNLQDTLTGRDTYYPAHKLTGRPGMHYLKMNWSHGQSDLVQRGFTEAMAFVDQALERGEGVLVHCQCGISRSGTLVIALVMRAAALRSSFAPPEVWELKGMQAAYAYVKQKSKWVGPNMSLGSVLSVPSLIYQLLDYERTLRADGGSPLSDLSDAAAVQDEEWGRKRQMMEEASESEDIDQESVEVQREARALDKAMEDRILARKSSSSSVGSGLGMGAAWRNRYSSRKRTGSIASNVTSNSVISEDLVEEDEEEDLLGTGGGFDRTSIDTSAGSVGRSEDASTDMSSDGEYGPEQTPMPPRRKAFGLRVPPSAPASRSQFLVVPPSAPATKSSFKLPPVPASATRSSFKLPPVPATATRSSFKLPPVPASATRSSFKLPPVPTTASAASFDSSPLSRSSSSVKPRRRPAPLGLLPTVPDSPSIIIEQPTPQSIPENPQSLPRQRKESRKPTLPPLHLRRISTSSHTSSRSSISSSSHSSLNSLPVSTPSQTLFVFPPSPTMTAHTPSAMTLTSNASVPFPTMSTPRVASFTKQGKRRSFIGLMAPPTPTTAHSRVDARGWIGTH
ncbi:hypothetical protein OF83DRAFT_1080770 [Amylostereum chailletii]|nr:hypothetical protein OF83DRAFT_1080770 [Amylostereum chailletii]